MGRKKKSDASSSGTTPTSPSLNLRHQHSSSTRVLSKSNVSATLVMADEMEDLVDPPPGLAKCWEDSSASYSNIAGLSIVHFASRDQWNSTAADRARRFRHRLRARLPLRGHSCSQVINC